MDIKGLQKRQKEFDNRHGFPTVVSSVPGKYLQISKDLVGLLGEIGEFANIVKKVNLSLDRHGEDGLPLSSLEQSLREELIDSFIYLIRLATILEVDVEAEYLKKMLINERKYEDFK